MKEGLKFLASKLATIGLAGAGVGIGIVFRGLILGALVSLCVAINPTYIVGILFAFTFNIFLFLLGLIWLNPRPIVLGFKQRLGKIFTIRNIFTMLGFAIIGWYVKTKIVYYFDLDVNNLLGYLYVIMPTALITSVLKAITESFMEDIAHTLTPKALDVDVRYKHVHYSAQGGGSADASSSRSASKQAAIDRYSAASQNELVRFANSPGDPGISIPDPQGIGARGYIPGGINQPYAAALAAELKSQGVSGKTYHPELDATAKRFLAAALPHIRPEVYGPQPTASTNASMIVQNTIKKLEKMP